MIKFLINLFVLSIVSVNVNAQVSFEISAGPNATFIHEQNLEPSSRIGFQVAGNVLAPLNKRLTLLSGLQLTFANFSEQLDFGPPGGYPVFVKKLNSIGYLEIPVSLKASIYKKFYALAGPKYSLLIYHNIRLDTDQSSLDFDSDHGFNSSLLSLRAGIGYNLFKGLDVGIVYDLGLSDLRVTQYNDQKETLSLLQLNFSYKLDRHKSSAQ